MGVLDEFFPFDLGHGNPANTARWRKMASEWQNDGVLYQYLNQLNATLSGTTITVNTGGVYIHGYYGEVQNSQSITGVGTNGTVVAGVDFNAQQISIYYRDGVVSYGSNPTTNYEQSANKWEIPLWLVNGTILWDVRTRILPGSPLGWNTTYAGSLQMCGGQPTSQQIDLMPIWVPFNCYAEVRSEISLNFTDASQLQNVQCQLTYQYGQADAQLASNVVTPAIPGGGPAGQSDTRGVAISGSLLMTQGRKTVGWQLTASTLTTGPAIKVPVGMLAVKVLSMGAMH